MRILRFVALATFVLAVSACAPGTYDGADQADGSAEDGPASCPDTIVIQDFAFEPASCSVEVGSTLTFVNEDDVQHTATSDPGAAATFDTGLLDPGESATVTIAEAGSSPYHCEVHPSMQATLEASTQDEAAASAGDDGGSGSGY